MPDLLVTIFERSSGSLLERISARAASNVEEDWPAVAAARLVFSCSKDAPTGAQVLQTSSECPGDVGSDTEPKEIVCILPTAS
eukprot:CAMPEP_0206521956 /NCGR_PEP_ID=MMETSP0324_2-20121206/66684_1 /ASSEMBLY_ACC=CAM_ASM_000836 /TAXON_ID=2866 /ORGANISM="Crypthecodinium cohnii, Strain Seligo" /LENGTH=82 /DNA_ID=CAMNT_0054016005 /DNA_START=201 /DNA_END=446 /DNA_ORIENTATION=-